MELSRLAEQCQKCPYKDNCKNKRMEALRYFLEPMAAELNQPILRETVNTIIYGEVVKMYKDEIEKQFYKELYSHLGLKFGG